MKRKLGDEGLTIFYPRCRKYMLLKIVLQIMSTFMQFVEESWDRKLPFASHNPRYIQGIKWSLWTCIPSSTKEIMETKNIMYSSRSFCQFYPSFNQLCSMEFTNEMVAMEQSTTTKPALEIGLERKLFWKHASTTLIPYATCTISRTNPTTTIILSNATTIISSNIIECTSTYNESKTLVSYG